MILQSPYKQILILTVFPISKHPGLAEMMESQLFHPLKLLLICLPHSWTWAVTPLFVSMLKAGTSSTQ